MKKHPFRILAILLAVSFSFGNLSCTTAKKSVTDEKEGIDTGAKDSVHINNHNVMSRDTLAPGTALVLFLSFNVSENNPQKVVWQTSVKEVLDYGSSTPPLIVGESLQVDATGYFMIHGKSPSYYAEKDSLICLISHKQTGDFTNSTSEATWELVDILKN